ncbi:MAG: hypothetical protein ACLGGX_06595 [Bdellovibrionia bacterium]
MGQVVSELRLFSDSFVSTNFAATEKSDYQFFGAHLKTDPSEKAHMQMDISGAVAFGAPLLNFINISEFYYLQDLTSEQKLIIGRHKYDWSRLDRDWNFGLWEPLFKWNPLAAQRQGLSGIFWNVHRPQFQLTLFASPLYIPDQGPSYEISEGKFVRGNPWFRSPPEEIRIFGENTRINYNILTPNEADIVLQSSYGGRLLLGSSDSFLATLSYMYKPANQLALGYDGQLSLNSSSGEVEVQPAVFYHSLLGGDISYRWQHFEMGVSSSLEKPQNEKLFEEGWTVPTFTEATLTSVFASFEWRNTVFAVQWLDVQGGQVQEVGEFASSERRALTTRYPFRSAGQVSIKNQLRFSKGRGLTTQVSALNSPGEGFSLVRGQAQAELSRLWSFYGELQFVKQEKDIETVTSELAQFANNDRFMLGVSYVF